MTLMTIVGLAGSGRTGILGSNAVTQSVLGRSVLILSAEHKDLEPYLRLTPNHKQYQGAGGIKLTYMRPGDTVQELFECYADDELPEVLVIDIPFNNETSMEDALVIHERLSKKHRHPLVCVSIQANRAGRLSSKVDPAI